MIDIFKCHIFTINNFTMKLSKNDCKKSSPAENLRPNKCSCPLPLSHAELQRLRKGCATALSVITFITDMLEMERSDPRYSGIKPIWFNIIEYLWNIQKGADIAYNLIEKWIHQSKFHSFTSQAFGFLQESWLESGGSEFGNGFTFRKRYWQSKQWRRIYGSQFCAFRKWSFVTTYGWWGTSVFCVEQKREKKLHLTFRDFFAIARDKPQRRIHQR